ncbi:MAG: hypothetical protein ACJAXJ_004135 [Colwellia sp.]|jgi:hypothetical protein
MDWLFDKIKNSACFDFYQLLKNIGFSQLDVETSFNNSVKKSTRKGFQQQK